LPPQDLTKLTTWLVQRDNDKWSRQMADDASAGRLDFLFQEAGEERAAGKLRDWPPSRP